MLFRNQGVGTCIIVTERELLLGPYIGQGSTEKQNHTDVYVYVYIHAWDYGGLRTPRRVWASSQPVPLYFRGAQASRGDLVEQV